MTSLFVILAACSGDDAGPGAMADAGPVEPPCEDVADTVLAEGAILKDAIVVGGKPVALVTTGQNQAAILRDGVSTPLGVAAYEGTLVETAGGQIVAVMHDRDATKTYLASSPDWLATEILPGVEVRGPELVYATRQCVTGGCADVDQLSLYFQGDFSAASAAHRDANGQWTEEELFLSSVSQFDDAANAGGEPIACVRFTNSAVFFGHHPYRGDLDDLTSYEASGRGCAIAANGRDIAMVFGTAPPRLAKWTLPYMPAGPWPAPPAATELALPIAPTGYAFDLAAEGADLVIAYNDANGIMHLANEASGWAELPMPAWTSTLQPILISDGEARHLFVTTVDDVLHYARTCR